MGARGPLPKPVAAKVLAGNPGKRPGGRGRSGVESGLPDRPSDLADDAAAEWDRIVPVLHAAGLLSTVDRAALVAYCRAFGRHEQASRDVDSRGMLIEEPIQSARGEIVGYRIKANPSLAIAREQAKVIVQLLRGFGLTPADRLRLGGGTDAIEQTADTNAVLAIRERLKEHRGK